MYKMYIRFLYTTGTLVLHTYHTMCPTVPHTTHTTHIGYAYYMYTHNIRAGPSNLLHNGFDHLRPILKLGVSFVNLW